MDSHPESPAQHEIDSVAHYTQAAADLNCSPLFIEEHRTLGISGMPSDGPVTYNLPDSTVRDAAVIPFRKMWMKQESSHFGKVSNIVKRHWPQAVPYVDVFKGSYKDATSGFLSDVIFRFNPHNITPISVVDLWLNCRLVHVGGNAAKGKRSRTDFEKESHRLGAPKFEYLFVESIYCIGLCYIGFSQLTRQLLDRWDTAGNRPTFIMDDIASQNSYPEQSGDRVCRSTPGMTVNPEDLVLRLQLLRRRKAFCHISHMLDLIEQDDSKTVELLRNSADVDELVANVSGEMRCVTSTDGLAEGFNAFSIVTDAAHRPIRKGLLFRYEERSFVAEGAAKEILEEQFGCLRDELLTPLGA